ncbi:MAG: hypothetical protein ACYDGX_10210 [Thermoleophilia bacterium]
MLLHDAYGKHFWIVSAESHGEIASQEIRADYQGICWKIADEIRIIDNSRETETILYTLFSIMFKSETDRADAFNKLLDDMGKELNPNYSKVMKQLSEERSSLPPDEFLKRIEKIQP